MSDINMMMREHDRHIQTIREGGAIMQELRERIADLEYDNKQLQSAHDKLKEALELCADDVDTYACHLRFRIDEDKLKGMKARHIAHLYLTPEEMEENDE